MRLIDWLTRAAPAATDPAPDIPNAAPHLPPEDAPESAAPEMFQEADGSIPIDEVFTAIEYRDASGNLSRRRITMLKLVPGSRGIQLQAICHERKAFRNFRIDRIAAFISLDGEILEPQDYWNGIGIDPGQIGPAPRSTPARALCDALRAPLSVLVTLSRCDQSMHPDEMLAILTYVADEALYLGVPCDDDTVEQLAAIIRAMRPRRESIKDHFLAVLELDERAQRRFVRAAREVILADGRIAREEAALAEKLEDWTAEQLHGEEAGSEDAAIAVLFQDRLARIDFLVR